MPSSRCPYGPAHEQPPRDWMPNRSLSSATTKLWCRYRPLGARHHERHDRQPLGVEVAEDLDVRLVLPRLDRAAQVALLVRADHVDADRLLELEHQAGPDRLDDRRRAALLAVHRVVEVAVLGRVDVGDRAAARHVGHPVAQQLAADDQHAGRARPADELVRAEEDRVLVRTAGPRRGRRTSRSRRTARRRRSPRTTARRARCSSAEMRVRVADDAGDVAGGRERADLQRPVGVLDAARASSCGEVDVAVGVLAGSRRRRRSTRATAARWSGARTAR